MAITTRSIYPSTHKELIKPIAKPNCKHMQGKYWVFFGLFFFVLDTARQKWMFCRYGYMWSLLYILKWAVVSNIYWFISNHVSNPLTLHTAYVFSTTVTTWFWSLATPQSLLCLFLKKISRSTASES